MKEKEKKPKMSTAARKAKGRRLQSEVLLLIKTALPADPNLLDCINTTPMNIKGVDIQIQGAARDYFPFAVECKNDENRGVWHCWEQAVTNSTPRMSPLLFMKKNFHDTLAVMRAGDFIKLFREILKNRYPDDYNPLK